MRERRLGWGEGERGRRHSIGGEREWDIRGKRDGWRWSGKLGVIGKRVGVGRCIGDIEGTREDKDKNILARILHTRSVQWEAY